MDLFRFSAIKSEPDYTRVAWHEAGHAVAAICFGVVPDRLVASKELAAEAGKPALGFVALNIGALAQNASIVALAGLHSENLLLRQVGTAYDHELSPWIDALRTGGWQPHDTCRVISILAQDLGREHSSDVQIDADLSEIFDVHGRAISDETAAELLRKRFYWRGLALPKAELLEAFRKVEAETIELVWRPHIAASIRTVATALVERRQLTGTDLLTIIPHFAPPALELAA